MTESANTFDFDRIKQVAEQALRQAESLSDDERKALGAVNWGDIGVGDVVHCRNARGETWFYVEVGEASPGCGLGSFMHNRLHSAFPGVHIEVRTEW